MEGRMGLELSLSTARSGLALLSRQLAQASADIANAGTAGYTDKTVQGRSLAASGQPFGVRALPAERLVDAALRQRLLSARAGDAAAATREAMLVPIERAHGRIAAGESLGDLSARLQQDLLALRDAPADPLRQRAVVTAAEDLVGRFHAVGGAVLAARQEAHDRMTAEVASLNAALREVARLTEAIRTELASGRSVADLEDRRAAAIAGIAASLDITVLHARDGGVTLVTRGGVTLPLELDRDVLSLAPASVGPEAFHGPSGTLPGILLGGSDVTAGLRGGRLGELVSLRDGVLPRMLAELDTLAAGFAARFEAQGLRLFEGPSGLVPDPGLPYTTGGALGFSLAIRVSPAVAADPTLVRDGTHAVGSFVPNPPGGPAGFTLLLDRVLGFALGPEEAPGVPHTPFASSGLGPDGSLVARVVPQATLAAQAAQIVAAHGVERAEAGRARESASALAGALEARLAEASGVDIDRELAAMVALQNAYAANARVMAAVQQMFDSLLSAVR
jgi:flagellar hook-associated protein 1 FlgK